MRGSVALDQPCPACAVAAILSGKSVSSSICSRSLSHGAIIPHSVLVELLLNLRGWTLGFLYTCLSDGSPSLKGQITLEVWCEHKFPVVRGSSRWKCTGSLIAAECERATSKRCRSYTDVDYLSFYMSLSILKWSGKRHASYIRRRIDNRIRDGQTKTFFEPS